ncbi:NAD(P)(+)-binding domain-containing protein (plasmid) [Rhizobium gallicum bv. gallicum R602sp]|uniref:NAD(P)(+)-binding domain-containing protein n=1 Tax=Rhizobium gallicum bv. gallicum R602sp TaxID=1041138 RepID=A0A0B4XHH1_9HYPH|nr:NAD(P)(+)-binding domain-containing protein [Rhizobium gallicum bv. gallicum R602sp]
MLGVTAVMRSTAKAASLKSKGAQIAMIDVGDARALAQCSPRSSRISSHPPRRPSIGTPMPRKIAPRQTSPETVLVESYYGAQPGDAIGDLSVLWNFETSVGSSGSPVAISRGAYYLMRSSQGRHVFPDHSTSQPAIPTKT